MDEKDAGPLLGILVGLVSVQAAGDSDNGSGCQAFPVHHAYLFHPGLFLSFLVFCCLSEPISRPAAAWAELDPQVSEELGSSLLCVLLCVPHQ
jgi:hypothetical protein